MFDDDMFSSNSDFSSNSIFGDSLSDPFGDINPGSGLPMMGCIDVEGNPWGDDSMSSAMTSEGSLFDGW